MNLKYAKINNNPERFIIIDPITSCWIWQKGFNSKGYGYFRMGSERILAHRYFYEKKYGKITEKYPNDVLDHVICNNRKCCNPDHVKPSNVGKNWGRYERKPRIRVKGHYRKYKG